MTTTPRAILEFWFSPQARLRWFEQDKAFDEEIRGRFGIAVHAAQQGELDSWQQSPEATLALLLLLDQFSRNIHRGQAKAFLGDARARDIADRAIGKGFDRLFDFLRRRFFYLPFEHGESLADQQRAIMLFERALDEAAPQDRDTALEQLDYAHRHRVVIERFGRFPHRNEALGRPSTEAEIAFLREPDSSF
ncbi:MAG TPA: DUF924 family protein [Dongiaceae bacterium]|nr:DUF924 family protein [Dongiaceae bacterium]